MRRLIALLFALAPLSLFGAVGDLIGLEVETNGYILRATIEGLNTNGMFYNGFLTNNTLSSTNMLTLTVIGPGYTPTGGTDTKGRFVFGTKILRLPYPLGNTNDIQAQGSDVVARIALSGFVASNETVTATARAGWFAVTNGTGTNANAFTAQAVTNSSTKLYPLGVGNWGWVGYEHVTSSIVTLRAPLFHHFAQNGKPLAAVKFIGTDTNGASVSNIVTEMTYDRTMDDETPIWEYISRLDCTGLQSNSPVRFGVIALPWVGDTNGVLTTTTDQFFQPTPYFAAITNWYDPLRGRPVVIACVATNGNDTTGRATNGIGGVVGSAAEALPFLTLGRAITAIAGTNNWLYGISNYGGGFVHLRAGDHSYLGSSATPMDAAPIWLTVTRHPFDSRDDVQLRRGATGISTGGRRLRFYDITINSTNALIDTAANTDATYWFDQCVVNHTGASGTAPLIQASGANSTAHSYWTHCIISNNPAGFVPFGSQKNRYVFFRGNDFSQYTNTVSALTIIGNYQADTNADPTTAQFITSTGRAGDYAKSNWVFAFNRILGFRSDSTLNPIAIQYNSGGETNSHGGAFVQNVIEHWKGQGGNASVYIAADSATGPHINNILIWRNTVAGQRVNIGYNDSGSAPYYRDWWSQVGNSWDDDNIKTDDFGGSPSAARIGNWNLVWSVESSGSYRGEIVGTNGTIGAQGFVAEFVGMGSFWQTVQTNAIKRYVDSGAYNGDQPGHGFGNYRLRSDSPLFRLTGKWVLPGDIEGNPRSVIDPPGAYSAGNVKKGAFF